MHDMNALAQVGEMTESPGWRALRDAAMAKVKKHEDSVQRLLFRTRTPVDPLDIEYDRGFQQGVMFVLDGLPNSMAAEFARRLKEGGD